VLLLLGEEGVVSWDWKKFARAWERVGWLLLLLLLLLLEVLKETGKAEEFGVVLLMLALLVSRDRCVESDGAWLLLDKELEVVVILDLVSVSGSVLITVVVAAFCL
jgi:hypothetical protein